MNPVIIGNATLYHADCIEVMTGLPDNSLDAIISDPPYLINFMGKAFDTQHKSLPGVNEGQKMQEWHRRWVTEAYRILKPGGHLAAFGGDRTHHRLMSAMEDVGFELRFNLYWAFGSGFPKSQNASIAIDKMKGAKRERLGSKLELGVWNGKKGQPGQNEGWKRPWMDNPDSDAYHITANATPEAAQWSGYGTALKPAVEICCVGRKPMIGTLAENLLEWECGAMNLDACRVDYQGETPNLGGRVNAKMGGEGYGFKVEGRPVEANTLGRFPPHLLHDGSDVVKQCFPDRKGWSSQKHSKFNPYGGNSLSSSNTQRDGFHTGYNDDGSSARFFPSLPYDEEDCATLFYCAKASRTDRNEGCEMMEEKNPWDRNCVSKALEGLGSLSGPRQNNHVSVKPTNLMRWICRLLTPKGGTLLDPFMGSGSTLKAAILENFSCIGIEMDEDYFAIAEARVAHVSPEIIEVKRTERSIHTKQQASFF